MQAHGGHIFKTVGDAFCVAFNVAGDAAGAALEAQRRLLAEDWSAVEGLRVRMAIHAGDAHERDGDYFGPAVNRVARLLSTANGGQVVVSGVVADLLGGHLPPHASLHSLGTFRLKDLTHPERVYQLNAEGLPAHFRPLRTLDALPNNLPAQTSGFVGRQADIAQILALLHESTLVTIAGPGGVGKTRVALACAVDVIDHVDDGMWFVNLAPLSDPAHLVSTVLTALGVHHGGENDELQTLTTYLKNRELLLILDNCEHLVEQAARMIAAIRECCPHVTILATSREVLHLQGERVYRLPPLEPSDCVRLFAQRAALALPQFALTAENTPTVEEICRHLDGIPLAIELAAARMRILTLETLLNRLSERFRVLTGGSRTALPRQQTLRALIDWSYGLLTDQEKALFRRVSIFSGSFALEAAGAVCSDDGLDEWTILDLLSSLVDKSLVVANVQDQRQRFYLLETIHEYAREKLVGSRADSPNDSERLAMLGAIREYAQSRLHEAGEMPWLSERHALFFAQCAQAAYAEFDTYAPRGWPAVWLPDLDNFRAALHWTVECKHDPELGARIAGDIAPAFMRLSLLNEGLAWCTQALDNAATAQPEVRARLEYDRSMLYNNQGAYSQAFTACRRAVDLYRQSNDERGLIRALSQLAQLYARSRRYDQAQEHSAEAIERARACGDKGLLAAILRRCAFALPPSQIEQARSQFADAVDVLRSLGDHEQACQVLQWWAEAEAAAECFDRATKLALEALDCAEREDRMYLSSNIAGYALASRQFERAEPYIAEALELAVDAGHPLLTAIAIAYCAAIGLPEDAADAARLFGYGRARMLQADWEGIRSDQVARENIVAELRKRIASETLAGLFDEGAAWDEPQAVKRAEAVRTQRSAEPSTSPR